MNETEALTSISDDDIYFNAEMIKKIKLSTEQAKNSRNWSRGRILSPTIIKKLLKKPAIGSPQPMIMVFLMINFEKFFRFDVKDEVYSFYIF